MIVDCHTHLMWYPDHIDESYAGEALASKLVKLARSGGRAYTGHLDLHSYDSVPETHWKACEPVDRAVVFGLQAPLVGVDVPNELIASYVAEHPEKLVGWASVDPNRPDCLEHLTYCVEDLGLKGLKLGPPYQHFDPSDRKHWPLYQYCERKGLPIMWHQGATFPSRARLSLASPMLIEDVTMAFPDLRMIVAHLAHPWEEDLTVLIRKSRNLYTDISAVHYRPMRFWRAMVDAIEYGIEHRILLGSDFPSATVTDVINGLHDVNKVVEGSHLPTVSGEVMDMIVHENWKAFFPEWAVEAEPRGAANT